jgi:gluconate 5-dehydrogenase
MPSMHDDYTARPELAGKVALVTGAGKGIGLEIACGLAGAGARVVLHGRDEAGLEAARSMIPDASIATFDLSDPAAIVDGVAGIVALTGGVDILIGNAGMRDRRPFAEVAVEDFRALLDINLTANFVLARAVADRMIARGWGRMIFISSTAAEKSDAANVNVSYSASKGGLNAMTRALAVALGEQGITVNAISPGNIATAFNATLFAEPRYQEIVRSRLPARRFGQATDVAGAAIFLASDAGDYVTGNILTIDGGLSITL